MKAVIIAAGQGTRMWPLTEQRPKPMLQAGGKPLLEHVLALTAPHVDEIVLVVGYEETDIKAYFDDEYAGTPLTYVTQDHQQGTAHAIQQAREEIDAMFLALNADIVIDPGVIERLANTSGPAVIGQHVPNPTNYGVFAVENDFVTSIIEKPADPPSDLANLGVYKLPANIFEYIDQTPRSSRGEFEITDSLQRYIDDSGQVSLIRYDGTWLDVGRPWELLEANAHFLADQPEDIQGTVEENVTLNGQVRVAEDARIRSGTYIDGDVTIQSGADIGPNAYIRGATTIGPDTRVGNAVEIKNSILMRGASVGHQSYVGDSILGADINLGAGTNVANLRHDDKSIHMSVKGELVDTGRRKLGVILGDHVKTGINTSLNAGIAVAPGETTLPGETVLENRR